MRKNFFIVLLICGLFIINPALSLEDSCIVNFDLELTASDIPNGPPSPVPDDGGIGAGGVVGITGGAVAGAAGLAGAGAYAAPFFLAGLSPGIVTGAAAPLIPVCLSKEALQLLPTNPYLTQAVKCAFNITNPYDALKFATPYRKVLLIPDTKVLNGNYNILRFNIPREFLNSPGGVKLKITQASQPFKNTAKGPELDFRMFTNLDNSKIGDLFGSRKFLSQKFIENAEISMMQSATNYSSGIVKKTGVINIQNARQPVTLVTSYMKNGALPANRISGPESQIYSYLIEIMPN